MNRLTMKSRLGTTGDVKWAVYIEGEDDGDLAAGIIEQAVKVLRDD